MSFTDLFPATYPIIGCVHLPPLPGSPSYQGDIEEVFRLALADAHALTSGGVDGIIVENFNDHPFYKDHLPAETIAAMSVAAHMIKQACGVPVGINALRNDASAALGISVATGADFIRVNVHMHAMLTDQGIIEGKSYDTLRKRAALGADVLIFADINVKHAHPLVTPHLGQWTEDLTKRGLTDAIIVTGSGTGKSAQPDEIEVVRTHTDRPVLIGSGLTADTLGTYMKHSDGAIVGSALKYEDMVQNAVDQERVQHLITIRNSQ